MAKVGRNDPCPCGSGKKYKNCCLRQDRISESRELSLRGEEAVLLGLLYDYAQSPRFELSLVEAMNFYWGGVYDWRELPDHVEVDDLRRMIEWFVHDYRTGEERRYVIDLFAEERGVTLEPRVREVLEAWSRSAMGLFRVLEITDGRIRAYDPLREEELQIEDRSLARLARPGELLVGRLFELDGAKRLSLMTMLLPGAYETPLVEYVRNAYHRYQEEHYQATWDRFLRENGHLFNAFMLSPRAEPLRSLIGAGTRYHDPAVMRDRLRTHTAEREREERRKIYEREQPAPAERRTSSGIILPGHEAEEGEEEKPRASTILIPGRDF